MALKHTHTNIQNPDKDDNRSVINLPQQEGSANRDLKKKQSKKEKIYNLRKQTKSIASYRIRQRFKVMQAE